MNESLLALPLKAQCHGGVVRPAVRLVMPCSSAKKKSRKRQGIGESKMELTQTDVTQDSIPICDLRQVTVAPVLQATRVLH